MMQSESTKCVLKMSESNMENVESRPQGEEFKTDTCMLKTKGYSKSQRQKAWELTVASIMC